MVAIPGTYENGYIKLDQPVSSKKPVKVIVTFLEEIKPATEKRLSLSDFSYTESRKNTENYKGSFSDTLIEERRSEL